MDFLPQQNKRNAGDSEERAAPRDTITANVAQSAEEAEMQAKGIDPLRRRDEEEDEEETAPRAAASAVPTASAPPDRVRTEAGTR